MVTARHRKTQKVRPFQFQLWKAELKEAVSSHTIIQIPSTQILRLQHISEIQDGSKFYETLLTTPGRTQKAQKTLVNSLANIQPHGIHS